MLKLIHCDLYKTFHRYYFYMMALVLGSLCILVNAVMAHPSGQVSVSFSWRFFLSELSWGLFLPPMLTEIVLAEEHREHILKNAVSFGTNRSTLVVAKLVTSVLLGLLLIAAVLAFYCGSSLLLLPKDAAFTPELIRRFFEQVGTACLVYVAALALSTFLAVSLHRNSLFVFAYYGAIFLTEYLFRLLRISFLNRYLLKAQFSVIRSADFLAQMQMPLLVAVSTLAAFTICGLLVFKRQDVA